MVTIELQTTNLFSFLELQNLPKVNDAIIETKPIYLTRGLHRDWQIAIFTVFTPLAAQNVSDLIDKYFGDNPTANKITINRQEIEYSKGEIIRVIKETTAIQQ